ncbi:MAG TPA: DNA gyrase inhibitor YacG [Terriglobales bacterium]|nr:DNA gyrase inhibitor YacG [Terriglobales bacterium]
MAKHNKVASLRCPTCRKIVLRTEPEFPFCSERCRTIDLGRWASGGYVISTPVSDPDDLDAIGYQGTKTTQPEPTRDASDKGKQ